MPEGFDPELLIEKGKNPGLGIHSLHSKGIDGRGVGMAIIDQPLLTGHQEYASALVEYDAKGIEEVPVQMHGPPVASIAVGKKVGVAPGAELTYFAVAMWKRDNECYIQSMKKIFLMNETLPEDRKIRVVSISNGMFPQYAHYDEWQEVLLKADSLGIVVITCQMNLLKYGTATATLGGNPDDPANYTRGKYSSNDDELLVPTGNTTVASHLGIDDYTFYRQGGMSWAAPYIAGVVALGYQVNPDIKPATIVRLLKDTATRTDAGPIINPVAFVEEVEEISAQSNGIGRE